MSLQPTLSLETFAKAMAQIESTKQLEPVLSQLDLTEAAWLSEVEAWDTRIADELGQGHDSLLLRYQEAYRESLEKKL